MKFQKATKKKARLRLAFIGPAGSGKTYSALSVAKGLGGKVAVIDTEHGSASKYADRFEFDSVEPDSFSPDIYVEAIHAAEEAGYDVLIIDSLSHAWTGAGGILEIVDSKTRASKSGNAFATGWRDATPKHNAMIEAILACKCHVIATMRTKTEWVIEENQKGKKEPRRVGLAPVQRDGLEYEFDVVGDLDIDNNFAISKTRCPALSGKVITKPGESLAQLLAGWLSDGVEAPLAQSEISAAWKKAQGEGMTAEGWKEAVSKAGVTKPSKEWTREDFVKVVAQIWPPPPETTPATNGAVAPEIPETTQEAT